MSRTTSNEPLNDIDERLVAAAEADLDRLLVIEPSPDFAAQVRARIQERREPRRHMWRWWFGLALASAAALIVMFVGRTEPMVPDGSGTPTLARQADVVLPAPAADDSDAGPSPLPVGRSVVTSRPKPLATARAAEPEVLIDPSVAAAIRRLVISARNTALDASDDGASASSAPVDAALAVPEPLVVPELALKPAEQTGGK